MLVSLLAGFAIFFGVLFAPVMFSGRYMTGGDGLSQALPTYLGRNPLWEPNMMLGYPLFADPNQAYWYPLLRALRALPFSFNAYAAIPYVIASFGVAGFARRASDSVAGGIVAGLTFALGGFMISHQGHLNLIHPAAWAPYLLWAIEELRRRPRFAYAVGGATALALSALGGTQQPLAYITLVAIAYAIVFRPKFATDRARFWSLTGLALLLGIGLSAIGTLPTAEFLQQSSRAAQTHSDYVVFSIGLVELPVRAFFPFFLGATGSSAYPFSAVNVGAFSETTNYAGILPLMLVALTLTRATDRRQVWFWFAVAVWGLWMSLGDGLLGARLAQHIPVYGLFRIPGRHALEFTLAVAILAAHGVRTLEREHVRVRDVAVAILSVGTLFAVALLAIALHGNEIRATVERASGPADATVPIVPSIAWQNPALAIPCIVLIAAAGVLIVWSRFRSLGSLLGVIAVTCDMLTFAGFSYWRYTTVPTNIVQAPGVAMNLRARLAKRQQRILVSLESRLPQTMPPNLSTLWSVPTVGAYVSLEDQRIATLLQMEPTGEVPVSSFAREDDAALNLVGARFILAPPAPSKTVPVGQEFTGENLSGFIGSDRVTLHKVLAFGFAAVPATAIDLVSALGLSMSIPDGAPVADIVLTDDTRRSFVLSVVAGRDTSESAYDRPDVHAAMHHKKARVFGGSTDALLYVARFHVPTRRPITRIVIRWRYANPGVGALSVVHVALVDEARGVAYPVPAYPPEWRRIGTVANGVIFENPRALPGAWTVPSVLISGDDAQVATIQEAAVAATDLAFDPRSEVITSDLPSGFGRPTPDWGGAVRVLEDGPTTNRYEATCTTRCMLVMNGLFYPGWRASVDAGPVAVVRVDYLLRGIELGPGHHTVATWFAPRSLAAGAFISAISALLLLALFIADLAGIHHLPFRRGGLQQNSERDAQRGRVGPKTVGFW